MKPLNLWPLAQRRALTGVFTDIDDTLTSAAAITPDALQALADLEQAGLSVIAITGRPVGWSEPFALRWPLLAIVAENGAVALQKKHQIGLKPAYRLCDSLSKSYQQDARTRAVNFERMQQVAAQVLRAVPTARLARDSAGRETDIAIDHSEFTQLPPAQIEQVVQMLRSQGMNVSVSSIHINAWFGSHNKLEGARWIVREQLGRRLDAELERWAYVGDSTNDQEMFGHFDNSIGVANIRRFLPQLTQLPRYITQGERGAGFAEVARAIVQARSAQGSAA